MSLEGILPKRCLKLPRMPVPQNALGGVASWVTGRDGLKVTQVRLIEIAQAYAAEREEFGQRLAERESVRMMLGDLAMRIEIGRLLVMRAAWELDRGGFARKEISMAKIHVANLLHAAADVGIQINGARGYSKDNVLEWIYRYARQARLVDCADAVHKMVLNGLLQEGRAGSPNTLRHGTSSTRRSPLSSGCG